MRGATAHDEPLSLKPPFIDGAQVPTIFLPSIRLVDLNVLAHKLWCTICSLPLSLKNCVEDLNKSLFKSELKIGCSNCSEIILVPLTLIDDNGNLTAYGSTDANFGDILSSKLAACCIETNHSLEFEDSKTTVHLDSYSLDTSHNSKEGNCEDDQEECAETSEVHLDNQLVEIHPTVEISIEEPQLIEEINLEDFEEVQEVLVIPPREQPAIVGIATTKKRGRKQTLEVFRDEPLPELQLELIEEDETDKNVKAKGKKLKKKPKGKLNPRPKIVEENIVGKLANCANPVHESSDEPTSESEVSSIEGDQDDWNPEEHGSEESTYDETDSEFDEETGKRIEKSEWKEKCFYCPLEFSHYPAATRHMRANHPDFLALKCGICERKSKTHTSFNRHLHRHRPSKKKLFCEFCGTFWTTYEYEAHLGVHITEATFECTQCPAKLKTAISLASHINTVHAKRTCDFCKKTVGRDRIENHILTHIGVKKRYKCKICHARFVHQDNRNTHMKNNHIYVCLVCFKQFTCRPEEVQEHAIKEHMTEEIEKSSVDGKCYEKVTRFQCQVCYGYFASKQSVQFHMHTHAKDDHEGQDGPQPKRRRRKSKES